MHIKAWQCMVVMLLSLNLLGGNQLTRLVVVSPASFRDRLPPKFLALRIDTGNVVVR